MPRLVFGEQTKRRVQGPRLLKYAPVLQATFPKRASWQLFAELNGYGSGWTDITADRTETAIQVQRGFQSTDPADLVAQPSTMTFALDNSRYNSLHTQSAYSLDAATSRVGWAIDVRVKLVCAVNGKLVTRFLGFVEDVIPREGIFDDQTVTVLAQGWFGQAATAPVAALGIAINQSGDQLVQSALAQVSKAPQATQIAAGLQVYPYAFDDIDPSNGTVMDAIDSIAASGLDRIYEKGDGTIVYETRQTRQTYVPAVLTITDKAVIPTYAQVVLLDNPVGYWKLGDRDGYAQAVLSDGALGYWRMDASSGTTETDRSTGGHNGTYQGSFALNQSGALSDGDAAAAFSNGNGYLDLGSVGALRPTAAFSIEAWINLNPVVFPDGTTNWIIYDWQVFNASGTVFRVDGGTGKLQAITNQAGAFTSAFSNTALTLNAWYHVIFTFDGTTGRFYLNGAADGSAAFTPPVAAANNVYVSRNVQGLVGSIDEVALYNYALSAQQVANHYALRTSTIATVAAMTMVDSSVGGWTADLSHGVTLGQATAQSDGSTGALFDGATGSYVQTSAIFTYPFGSGPMSLEYWFKTTSALAQIGVVDNKDAGTNAAGFNSAFFAGRPFFRIADGVSQEGLQSPHTFNDGNGHHFVAVLTRGTPDTLSIYIDGVLDCSVNLATSGRNITQSLRQLRLGGYSTGGSPNFFIGTLDDVAVYNTALTAAQVAAHFVAAHGNAPPIYKTLALTRAPVRRSRSQIKNSVRVTINPRSVDAAAVVLYALQVSGQSQYVDGGATLSYHCPYVDPNQKAQGVAGFNMLISNGAGGSMIGASGALPVTDYQAGTTPGGGGVDLSIALAVSVVYAATEAVITVTNTSPLRAYWGKLQTRGQGIYSYQSVQATQTKASSKGAIGQTLVSLNCPYNTDAIFADSAASYIVGYVSADISQFDGPVEVEVPAEDEATLDLLLQREISDTIVITETMTGVNNRYWINAETLSIDERDNVTIGYALAPNVSSVVWTLGVAGASELGVTTILGF